MTADLKSDLDALRIERGPDRSGLARAIGWLMSLEGDREGQGISSSDINHVTYDLYKQWEKYPGGMDFKAFVNEEIRSDLDKLASTTTPESNLRRIDAVFVAREQMLEFNVPPMLALVPSVIAPPNDALPDVTTNAPLEPTPAPLKVNVSAPIAAAGCR